MKNLISEQTLRELEKVTKKQEQQIAEILERSYQFITQKEILFNSNAQQKISLPSIKRK